MRNNSKVMYVGIIAFIVVVAIFAIGLATSFSSDDANYKTGKSLDELMEHIDVNSSELVKASVNLTDTSLYDELPEITKYPLVIEGRGKVDIEIFTRGW